MTNRSNLGQLGENVATRYLIKKGYKVLDKNHKTKWGEIDIIVSSPDKTLVFVEVKTVSGPSPRITPENQMTQSKRKKFYRAAEFYANETNKLYDIGWRTDLVAIIINNDKAEIKHYKNI